MVGDESSVGHRVPGRAGPMGHSHVELSTVAKGEGYLHCVLTEGVSSNDGSAAGGREARRQ